MSFPRYSEYKDSGVEWLGEVPAHWHLMRFKWQIDRNDGGVWGNEPDGECDTVVLRSTEQTVDGHWKLDDPACRKLSKSERDAALLSVGDLLVTKSSGSALHIGKTTLVTEEIAALGCCYSNFMQRIRTKSGFMPRLAWYLMNSEIARVQFDLASNSSTGLANLNGTMLGELALAVPSAKEQAQVVVFLDCEIAKIDALVLEQEKLITLLKEKRQAVISHAVIKGLNPDTPMKDSGIEWLGEVPAHWEIQQSRRLFFQRKDRAHSDDQQLTASQKYGVIPQAEFMKLEDQKVMQVFTGADILKHVEPNDFVISMRSFQGGIEWCGHRGCVSSAYVPLIPTALVEPRYFKFLFKSQTYIQALQSTTNLVRDGQALRYENFCLVPLPNLPTDEQLAIADFLDAELQKIDSLSLEAESGILLLKERRSALISAAVTGKIDVRGFVAAREAA